MENTEKINETVSYQITSIYDMFESVPIESLDNFLIDLKNMFIFKKRFEIEINQFTWTDDKKHDLTVNLKDISFKVNFDK